MAILAMRLKDWIVSSLQGHWNRKSATLVYGLLVMICAGILPLPLLCFCVYF